MHKFVNIENVVVMEQAELAGACSGFLFGVAVGAKVGSRIVWWLGPTTAPAAIASSMLIGGTVGAVGGSNLGKVVVSQLNV